MTNNGWKAKLSLTPIKLVTFEGLLLLIYISTILLALDFRQYYTTTFM